MTLTKKWLQRYGWPETLAACQPIAIAHRGASDHAPENTLAAFRVAADLAAEMWELDIRLSRDGVCVVSHDDDLARVTGESLRISTASWEQISALPLPDAQHVPRLEEVIDLARQTGCGLYIEIKSDGAGPLAWRLLREAGFRFAALGSFNVAWVGELRDAGCTYPLSVLVPAEVDPFAYMRGVAVEIVHLCWRNASASPQDLLTDELMRKLADHGHQVVLWDEDRVAVLDGLEGKPVMGICSNRPEMLKPYRPQPAHPIDIVCHRGANLIAPENTLEAARICADQRFQYVELDVRTAADGELVVMHDATLERTTNGSGPLAACTLSEIRRLDAGGWFRNGARGVQVPTLAEVLDLLRGRAGLYVEIKQASAESVLAMVTAHGMLASCFFWSADFATLRWLRRQSPDITLMVPRWIFASVAEAVVAYGAQIVEFDVERDDFSKLPGELEQCRALGVRSMIFSQRVQWHEMDSYLGFGPDMVNLDRPDRFKIVASHPQVRAHFSAMAAARFDG